MLVYNENTIQSTKESQGLEKRGTVWYHPRCVCSWMKRQQTHNIIQPHHILCLVSQLLLGKISQSYPSSHHFLLENKTNMYVHRPISIPHNYIFFNKFKVVVIKINWIYRCSHVLALHNFLVFVINLHMIYYLLTGSSLQSLLTSIWH